MCPFPYLFRSFASTLHRGELRSAVRGAGRFTGVGPETGANFWAGVGDGAVSMGADELVSTGEAVSAGAGGTALDGFAVGAAGAGAVCGFSRAHAPE